MFIHLQLLFFVLLPITTSYQPKDHYFISFGLPKSSTQAYDGIWRSDEDFVVAPPLSTANSTAVTSLGASQPYNWARVYRAPVTYSILVSSPGPKLVRLYFPPPSITTYNNFDTTNSSLSLTIDGFIILDNFSAYLAAANAKSNINTTAPVDNGLVREIYVTVKERDGDQSALNLTFSPSNPNGFGLINGLEIISVPDGLYVNQSSSANNNKVPYLENGPDDYIFQKYNFSRSLAMENVIRLNVGGSNVDDDTGLGRTWFGDSSFVLSFNNTPSYTIVHNTSTDINYTSTSLPTYTAPSLVYSTMRMVGPYLPDLKKNINLTWVFEVDGGFDYLVRLHFCELRLTYKIGGLVFNIYINNQMAFQNFDIYQEAGGRLFPIYKDWVTFVDNTSTESRVLLLVALVPIPGTSYDDAFLNGLEIFKLSLSNMSLAAPNPALPMRMVPNQLNNPKPPHNSNHLLPIIGGVVGAIIVSAVILGYFMVYRKRKADQKIMNTKPIEDSSNLKWVRLFKETRSTATTANGSVASSLPSDLCRCFSLAQIKIATCDFDDDLIIGTGGFGKVYKGSIDGGATTVAIKRLNTSSKQGAREFQTEIVMLSRLRHVHLVSLIGYCEDYGEMILVYEYMSKGTLRDHLLYKSPQIVFTPLSWKQRLKICIGSARGLHYLHAGAKHLIIHRDVKSTNILLDDKWTAKVSDFGLSKVGPTPGEAGASYVSTAVKGSAGYLDPEYYRRHQLTEKSDVYSFGVVLFEVLCARAAVNPNLPREQANLAMWARSHFKRGILQNIVDPNLSGQIAPESLRKFGEIADMCVRDRGSERPSMGDVVWGLEFVLQLQETAEKDNTIGGTEDGKFDRSSNNIIGGYGDITDNEILSSSQSCVVDGAATPTKWLLDSRYTTSRSSEYTVDHMKSGSVFSEIIDPTAR